MTWLNAIILSLVEGITEYLPISSTGHLILTSSVFGINEDPYVKSFNVIIQVGAVLAVVVLYWQRFLPKKDFYIRLVISFFPAAVIGLLVKKKIDIVLGSNRVVAWALIVGGIVLIIMDTFEKARAKGLGNQTSPNNSTTIETLSTKHCLVIGLIQCFAFIPGVSRAGAAILGGIIVGLNRKEAAEFSFFLAVPTLLGASIIKSGAILPTITSDQIQFLLFGTFLSFVVAMIAIRTFISLLSRGGFTAFGIYRIILGGTVLLLL
ncbi:MAG: undecaprenyl-diphosphate phosphatase [Pseudomonadota bacterium]|nr:undecaprenyl-diphosphate phosphatase [Pseudomonadota bacterium]